MAALLRLHDQSKHLVTSIAGLNCPGNEMIRGVHLQHQWSDRRWANDINFWPNAVVALDHLLGELIVCLGFVRILLNIVRKCF